MVLKENYAGETVSINWTVLTKKSYKVFTLSSPANLKTIGKIIIQ